MKTVNVLLLFLILFQNYNLVAQREPSKEILVFFKEGVVRESKTLNGKSSLVPSVKSAKLKSDLQKLGISESALEAANPQFNEGDTLKTLPNGTKVRLLNMTKLFRIKVENEKVRKELIDRLNKLPEVLYAEANGGVAHFAIAVMPTIQMDVVVDICIPFFQIPLLKISQLKKVRY